MSNLTGKNPENPLPAGENMEKLTDEFVDKIKYTLHIQDKIHKIRSELDEHPMYQPDRCDVPKLGEFCPISDKEILKIMYEI